MPGRWLPALIYGRRWFRHERLRVVCTLLIIVLLFLGGSRKSRIPTVCLLTAKEELHFNWKELLQNIFGGADGTRTRALRRDRPAL